MPSPRTAKSFKANSVPGAAEVAGVVAPCAADAGLAERCTPSLLGPRSNWQFSIRLRESTSLELCKTGCLCAN